MKKIFCLFILLLISLNCFSEELTSFLGIPFGSSKNEVLVQMTEKGWSRRPEIEYLDNWLAFSGKTYAGKEVSSIYFSFSSDKFYDVEITFTDSYNIYKIIDAFVEKYDLEYMTDSMYIRDDIFFLHYDERIKISLVRFIDTPELDMEEVEKDI